MGEVLHYHHDEAYHRIYGEGLARTGMPDSAYRRPRFYNLAQVFSATAGREGHILEAGCYLGLSARILAGYRRLERPDFAGEGMTVLDSFEGLSEPAPEDTAEQFGVAPRARPRLYAAQMDRVRDALSEFPALNWVKGWIPEVLGTLPERVYRFVHVDLDLHDPILASLEYFHPRLVPGGMLVVDDYGYLDFPGAKRAVDAFTQRHRLHPIRLTTGNAVLVKEPGPS